MQAAVYNSTVKLNVSCDTRGVGGWICNSWLMCANKKNAKRTRILSSNRTLFFSFSLSESSTSITLFLTHGSGRANTRGPFQRIVSDAVKTSPSKRDFDNRFHFSRMSKASKCPLLHFEGSSSKSALQMFMPRLEQIAICFSQEPPSPESHWLWHRPWILNEKLRSLCFILLKPTITLFLFFLTDIICQLAKH